MSTDPNTLAEGTPDVPRTPIDLRYAGPSQVTEQSGAESVALVANELRDPVRAAGAVRDPVRLREALSALYAVVDSDFRYVPKDRSAYLTWKQARKRQPGQSAWEARRNYFAWLQRNDPTAFLLLDPIVNVAPDVLSFEVFSRDEATWARVAVDWSQIEREGELTHGTTNIDFSEALYGGLQQLRSYRPTRLSIGGAAPAGAAVALETAGQPEVLEKKIPVPDSWIRGFLQVQSAATLPRTVLSLAPVDLYNALRILRMKADEKRKGRGLRVEIVPGERPRIVVEPWETVLQTGGEAYTGRSASVIRVWGRRRLMLVRRFLPFADTVEVHLLGSGLPSFWVLRGKGMTVTLGLTGFTSASWSQAISFDLLLPRRGVTGPEVDAVVSRLREVHVATAEELASGLKMEGRAVLAALQHGCQQGLVLYDLAAGRYRYRPLLGGALTDPKFEHRGDSERVAADLLAKAGAVRVESENRIPGAGLELVGRVDVEADRRDYRPKVLIDEDARVNKAECTCAFFRKHGLKEGPCPHLIALVALHAAEERQRRANRDAGGRRTITVETRTFVRRHARGEEMTQVSLNRKQLLVQWGERGAPPRSQRLLFDTEDAARDAYFARTARVEAMGFLDASGS